MSAFSRGLIALAGELFGLALLAAFSDAPGALAAYFAVHGAASAAAAVLLPPLLPPAQSRHPQPGSLFFFSLAFFLPVVGVVAALCVTLMARLSAARRKSGRFDLHASPIYEPRTGEAAMGAKRGVRARLASASLPVEARLRALLAVQSMPARMANPLIREMLSDPSEDLRLIAYGILDTREKTINARLHAATRRLETAAGHERAALEKQLAELYCELIYQGLVHGDLREHAAAQARAHVERALAIDETNPALHALSGQIALSSGDYRTAQLAFERGRALGLPESRVLPYLAEVAFRSRRFDQVRAIVRLSASLPTTQRINQVIAYWGAA